MVVDALLQLGDALLLLHLVVLKRGGLLLDIAAELLELRLGGLAVLAGLLGTRRLAVEGFLGSIDLHLDGEVFFGSRANGLRDLVLA